MALVHKIKAEKAANLKQRMQGRAFRKAEALVRDQKQMQAEQRLATVLREKRRRTKHTRQDPRYDRVLEVAAKLGGPVRDPQTWVPKGKSPETRFFSYAEHMLALYPTPKYFFSVFASAERERQFLWRVVGELARGASLYKLVSFGVVPIPFTRKMCHDFVTGREEKDVWRGLRWAQAKNLGADRRLFEAYYRQVGHIVQDRALEVFNTKVVAWFARNAMVDPNMVGPLFDYFHYRRNQDPTFDLSGRSVHVLMQGMKEWHALIEAKKSRDSGKVFKPSGWAEGIYQLARDGSPCTWYVEEILTAKRLAEESKKMHHCAFSYESSILGGRCSLWSIYPEDKDSYHRVTVEVVGRRVIQARGTANSPPSKLASKVLIKWASQNVLKLECWV